MGLDWKGATIKTRVGRASKLGIDATMGECVATSKIIHPWHNRTGFEEGSIQVLPGEDGTPGAHIAPGEVAGEWGALANYSLFLEIGTSREDSGAPRAEEREAAAGGNMDAIAPPEPEDDPLMRPRPFLRPSADEHYPLLPARIRTALSGMK